METREEMFLRAAAGETVNLPTPITRKEFYLAKAAGMDVKTPDPITREEYYLDNLANSGGGQEQIYNDLIAEYWGTPS